VPALVQQWKFQDEEPGRGSAEIAARGGRTCALTRRTKPVSDMIRFVVGPDEMVVPDVKCKLPGRGIWITANRSAVEDAVKRQVFAQGFKRAVKAKPNLAADTEKLLERAALDALGIVAKAGSVVAGFAKVETAIVKHKIRAILHASDGAADGIRKLNAAIWSKERHEIEDEIAIIAEFSGSQLDLALNYPNVVHAAVLGGPGTETFLARVLRLQRFRGGRSPDSVNVYVPSPSA
jgi:uncharacterized protein